MRTKVKSKYTMVGKADTFVDIHGPDGYVRLSECVEALNFQATCCHSPLPPYFVFKCKEGWEVLRRENDEPVAVLTDEAEAHLRCAALNHEAILETLDEN